VLIGEDDKVGGGAEKLSRSNWICHNFRTFIEHSGILCVGGRFWFPWEAPMDVHPVHGSIHSVRDFFRHLLTITIGILIALGLEGIVE